MARTIRSVLFVLALLLLVSGQWLGLVWAPPDREMGDVQRIMYVHLPAVWMGLLGVTLNFICSVLYLVVPSRQVAQLDMDALAEASAEVGLFFGTLGLLLGSIWGRPTWGVFWTWDPRLTSMAILLVAYAGYLALRRFIDDAERRATWSAVVGIIIAVDIPIIWFSVRWWNSLHQIQSSPKTVDPSMVLVLRWNAIAFLLLWLVFLSSRYVIARDRRDRELAPPPLAQEAAR
ncbi:MAG TPA: cytochrome c biogenesis protein CcsA [Myxococcaceae bacterium]|nr:cytochrome c biogenesis protein CcsA [Myxococcaceae bacterium]